MNSKKDNLTIFSIVCGIIMIFVFPYVVLGITRIEQSVTVSSNVVVTGSISKGSGTFVIDHPLDPKNKLLYHSFVESPDVKNIYAWQVTGIRHDPFILANPIVPEVEKGPDALVDKGEYLFPDLYE
ncbi:hypothetical protein HYW58_02195 [Candidatus Kaiserbacteria bacterium]|nr:hypothetical protein [Candidatus Kaiserbacteria bacterium]